eukprot:163565-Rhodomonas_salina.1
MYPTTLSPSTSPALSYSQPAYLFATTCTPSRYALPYILRATIATLPATLRGTHAVICRYQGLYALPAGTHEVTAVPCMPGTTPRAWYAMSGTERYKFSYAVFSTETWRCTARGRRYLFPARCNHAAVDRGGEEGEKERV